MTVLITGGTGFIGSHVARRLLQANQSVRLLVRDIEKAKAVFSRIDLSFDSQQCELVLGDITDTESINSVMQNVQAVIHAAAVTPIAAPSAQVLEQINIVGTKNVLDAALAVNVSRFIYVSSATAVFNTNASLIDLAKPLTMPSMPYGRSKAEAENLVRDRQQQGACVYMGSPRALHSHT